MKIIKSSRIKRALLYGRIQRCFQRYKSTFSKKLSNQICQTFDSPLSLCYTIARDDENATSVQRRLNAIAAWNRKRIFLVQLQRDRVAEWTIIMPRCFSPVSFYSLNSKLYTRISGSTRPTRDTKLKNPTGGLDYIRLCMMSRGDDYPDPAIFQENSSSVYFSESCDPINWALITKWNWCGRGYCRRNDSFVA